MAKQLSKAKLNKVRLWADLNGYRGGTGGWVYADNGRTTAVYTRGWDGFYARHKAAIDAWIAAGGASMRALQRSPYVQTRGDIKLPLSTRETLDGYAEQLGALTSGKGSFRALFKVIGTICHYNDLERASIAVGIRFALKIEDGWRSTRDPRTWDNRGEPLIQHSWNCRNFVWWGLSSLADEARVTSYYKKEPVSYRTLLRTLGDVRSLGARDSIVNSLRPAYIRGLELDQFGR